MKMYKKVEKFKYMLQQSFKTVNTRSSSLGHLGPKKFFFSL